MNVHDTIWDWACWCRLGADDNKSTARIHLALRLMNAQLVLGLPRLHCFLHYSQRINLLLSCHCTLLTVWLDRPRQTIRCLRQLRPISVPKIANHRHDNNTQIRSLDKVQCCPEQARRASSTAREPVQRPLKGVQLSVTKYECYTRKGR